ncbi:cysteine--tRNA ligase [Neorickettsia sennetsu]|uniref:Cysteine--tRNA ligase n=1 Tax=Ehrlichia sennetsu (strain ATCC VR-367 / Miyayama) TaxID=222891 RepID=SYC_EHRS3|nr:cysteine--tRNA ligase [Neorickettsia sennetsu]Q2GE74.1 RecName: Full=Cysteine--tRNA ligase; AltName: Full=Cysteinyl-tRNA synthetase; Short=CysRS [Neorickettsia sennetsu str. Miyayama]ABD45822.1 cysteinyl-tRNA synthetase [Neorickettsia sennetsu str. Miyayama]
MKLRVHNTLSGLKEEFFPLSSEVVRMYVCGPTVYDVPHIGNIRASVVYDIVYRVLLKLFPEVIYVRNITDVDDKIITAASVRGVKCDKVALHYEHIFHEHLGLLNCLSPTVEPKATQNIGKMISMIQALIDNGNAYSVGGNVYFDVGSFAEYGVLSKRKKEQLVYGVRVEKDVDKKHPGDFILWKSDDHVYWPSPWGNGRPGWHIECSAMTLATLGADFDIHGGGADLKFPHHENERAQSMCANPGSQFARYWVHNGFLTVNGEKMSKSLGNVVNVDTLVESGVTPNVIRFVLISTHYSKPLDWNDAMVGEAINSLIKFKLALLDSGVLPKSKSHIGSLNIGVCSDNAEDEEVDPRSCASEVIVARNKRKAKNFSKKMNEIFNKFGGLGDDCSIYTREFFECMADDFNTPGAIAVLHKLSDGVRLVGAEKVNNLAHLLYNLLIFLGIDLGVRQSSVSEDFIRSQLQKRADCKRQKDFVEADRIRFALAKMGVLIRDHKHAPTDWVSL